MAGRVRGARRQKWIDQSQSLNIYMAGASGKKLDETYKLAWMRGLKTTYYLRTLGATHAEKSTGKAGELNAVPADGRRAAEAAEEPSSARSTIPTARHASDHPRQPQLRRTVHGAAVVAADERRGRTQSWRRAGGC